MFNTKVFVIFWGGALLLQNGYQFVSERDGLSIYNFILYFISGIVWGYFWGKRLLKFQGDDSKPLDS
ncbi:MAG: hypothetical protein VKL41_08270 [Snowella sp.]|nr:hypothetical protein [Snowella sp.]